MPIITFLSDFGWQDHYVAAIKAKILSENDTLNIIDISHNIKKFDIIHASHVLKAVYKDFPENSINLCAVNVQSQEKEELIVARIHKRYFVGSNNGLLSLIDDKVPEEIYRIESEKDTIFPEKDYLASICSRLTKEQPADFLKPFPQDRFKAYKSHMVKATKEIIQGHVMHIDSYGNLITNIPKVDFDILSKNRAYQIHFRNYAVSAIHKNFSDVQGGEVFVLFNSENVLMLGIKNGNAAQLLGMEFGSMVSVKFS